MGPSLSPVSYEALAGWRAGRQAEALPALLKSCGRRRAERSWRRPCAALAAVRADDDGAARRVLERWFRPYRVATHGGAVGRFTGYFEISLRGARRRGGAYTVPIYAPPRDLDRHRAYLTRAEIESATRRGDWPAGARPRVLLWADDPVAVFFLHIQGSGRVRLRGGGTVRLGYAGDNGRRYVAIGRPMAARGLLPRGKISMATIAAWLRAHPRRGRALMAENPRYIFFREIAGPGPIGAAGVALTPGRSLAVDADRVALGTPLWLETRWPGPHARPLRRLMVAQDTGAAIKGAIRGDIFWGSGAAAARLAGRMNETGRYYLLLPRAPAKK